jgi:hypothetical protein
VTRRFGSKPTRLLAVAVLCAAAAAAGMGGFAVSDAARPHADAAGEDSPWPRTKALRPHVSAARRELARLTNQVELMEQSAENAEDWQNCLTYVPVNEQGDRDRQFGYLYDELDGSGPGYMDGIAVDRRRRWGREDYLFIHFRGEGCRSDNPQPGGTAEPASVGARPRSRRPGHTRRAKPGHTRRAKPGHTRRAKRGHTRRAKSGHRRRAKSGLRRQVTMLERKAARLFARSQRLETISERFDEWESCVSWVPVTEMGDPDQKFGYLYGPQGGPAGYRAGLHIDRSDWDDPDYMFLALVGGDRPGRTCQDEPGEAVD